MRASRAILGGLAVALTAEAGDAQPMPFGALTARPYPAPDAEVAYAGLPVQVGDLFVPSGGGPHPVVVLLHGGCWRAEYDRMYLRHLAGALRDDGVAVWLPEYRRLGESGGGWPGTFRDVGAAVDHLRVLAPTHRLDLRRVAVAGHSAGGHLALWVGARQTLLPSGDLAMPDPLPVRGIVGLAAITDLATYAARTGCGASVPLLLGGAPAEVPARVAMASPVALGGSAVPTWLVTGTRDPIVPAAQSDALVAAQPRRAIAVRPVEGAGHFELVAPWTTAWPVVRHAVREALGLPVAP